MQYVVYQITINNNPVYIGRTSVDRIDQREKEHNKAFLSRFNKPLYNYLHSINYTGVIALEPIFIAKNKLESKQYECYTILYYKFEKGIKLYQKTPVIKDF